MFHLGRLLALPTRIRLMMERLAKDKWSSLLSKLVTYGRKSFITLAPGVSVVKHFPMSLRNGTNRRQDTQHNDIQQSITTLSITSNKMRNIHDNDI